VTHSPVAPGAISLIAQDMLAVDAVITQRLSSGVAMVGEVAQYIISAGGKRLRPALLLLLCGALSCKKPARFEMAAVVEFIHTATLLHDDVVDESTLRRGRSTANEVFGNPASVLVGDFLYSRAFQMMVDTGEMRIMRILADATNVIAEGEVLQLMNMHDASIDEAAYLQVIRSKTAKLFEASARLAAVIANAEPAVEEACAAYGRYLGTAFQVVDDILDYEGDPEQLGKNLGDDLREGKATLPLIIAMQRGSEQQAARISEAIRTGAADPSDLHDVIEIVHQTGALERTHHAAASEAQQAINAIRLIPDNPYKEYLLELAANLLTRQS
jgi:octaprenyl-diphosphate synthase